MKHFFLTLIALCGISYAFAETHDVYFFDDADDPVFALIVDQYNNVYNANTVDPYSIADGTILTFTLNDPNLVVFCYDEAGEEYQGMSFTIDETLQGELQFAAGEPYGIIEVKVYSACDVITEVKINGMSRVDDFCKNHKDGYTYIRIPDLYEGDQISITSSVDIDWGEKYGGVGKTGTITYDQEVTATSEPIVINTPLLCFDRATDDYTQDLIVPLSYDFTYTGRTFYANLWNPVCFPFYIDQAKMEEIFGVNTVVNFESATFSASSGLTVECSYVTEGMKANTPYLVKPEADITGVIRFKDASIQNFEGKTLPPEGGDIKFIGTVTPVVLAKDDKTKLFIGFGNKVYYPDEDVTMPSFRAYFEIPAGTLVQGRKPGAARFIIRDRKAPTGVENNVMNTNNATKYMQNGRLVIENNGVRYNAQGQMID